VSLFGVREVVLLVSWWSTLVVEEEFRPLPIHTVDDNDPTDFVPDDNGDTTNTPLDNILVVVVAVSWPILMLLNSVSKHNWKSEDSHGVEAEDKNHHNDREVEDLETPNDLVVDTTVTVPMAIFDTSCCCCYCCCCIEKDDNTEAVEAIVSWRVVSDRSHVVVDDVAPCRGICFLVL
jgi:hypothetical protein